MDIRKSTRKSLEQRFVKPFKANHYCMYEKPLKFAKLSSSITPRCFICESGASYKIGIETKPHYDAEVILDRYVCETHKQCLEQGASCLSPNMPYLLAPCIILSSQNRCPFIKITERDPVVYTMPMPTKCKYEYQMQFSPSPPDHFCSVCGEPAIVKTEPQYHEISRITRKTLYFCANHNKPLGCSKMAVMLESAPCDLFENKSFCIYYEKA